MNVTYDGPSDFQEFGKADFAKADVEQGKLVFARGESTEVPDAVGKALTSKEGIFGLHQFSEVKEDSKSESAPADPNPNPDENADAGVEGNGDDEVPNTPEANPQRTRR